MMSIWARWLEPCLIGLSTSLHKIITVSKYSLPLIVIVGTLSECWSIVVIFACRCLYYHSTGHQWEWERIDDHDLLLIYSCCPVIEKTHICYLLDLHDFLINLLDMALRELVGILGLPSGKGSLFSVVNYCSSSEPVHGRQQSQTSSLVVASSVLHLLTM